MRLVPVLCVLVSLVSLPVSLAARQDHHATSDQRGAMVMGFDQARTTHHFMLFNDGGAIDVNVKRSRRHQEPCRDFVPIGRSSRLLFGDGHCRCAHAPVH
jgi:hypothetical protein